MLQSRLATLTYPLSALALARETKNALIKAAGDRPVKTGVSLPKIHYLLPKIHQRAKNRTRMVKSLFSPFDTIPLAAPTGISAFGYTAYKIILRSFGAVEQHAYRISLGGIIMEPVAVCIMAAEALRTQIIRHGGAVGQL